MPFDNQDDSTRSQSLPQPIVALLITSLSSSMDNNNSNETARRPYHHRHFRSRGHFRPSILQRPQTADPTPAELPKPETESVSVIAAEHDNTQSDPEDFGEKHVVKTQESKNVPKAPDNDQSDVKDDSPPGKGTNLPAWTTGDSQRGYQTWKENGDSHSNFGFGRRNKRGSGQRPWGSRPMHGSNGRPAEQQRHVSSEASIRSPPIRRRNERLASDRALMDTLTNVFDFAVPPNLSLDADSLILFKTNAQPIERPHALVEALHAELYLATSFVGGEPQSLGFADPVANQWKEVVMQRLLVEIAPRVGGFLQKLGDEVGLAMERNGAGVRTFVGPR